MGKLWCKCPSYQAKRDDETAIAPANPADSSGYSLNSGGEGGRCVE